MELLHAISHSTGTPLQMVVAGLLIMVGSCLGKSCVYVVKEGYEVSANLFVALVADSGWNKTGATKPFLDAISRYQKSNNFFCKTKDYTLAGMREYFGLFDRGLLISLNELSGLFATLGNNPGYKEQLLDGYDNADWETLQFGKMEVIIQACVSVFGAIIPDKFFKICKRNEFFDGFLTRFLLFLIPESETSSEWNDDGIDAKYFKQLDAIVSHLFNIKQQNNGNTVVINPSPGARQAYSTWMNDLLGRDSIIVDRRFYKSLRGKISGQVLKLATIQHFLEQICYSRKGDLVSVDAMNRAIALGEYFLAQQCTAWLAATASPRQEDAKRIDILQALYDCRHKIVDDFLATSDVVAAFNKDKPKMYRLTPDGMGRKLNDIGLTKHRTNTCRGFIVDDQSIDQLGRELANVKSAYGN